MITKKAKQHSVEGDCGFPPFPQYILQDSSGDDIRRTFGDLALLGLRGGVHPRFEKIR